MSNNKKTALGQGDVGQLGLGEDILKRKKPALVKSFEGQNSVQVECGEKDETVVSNNKKTAHVLTLGQGDVGQLGLGEDILERKKPALVKSLEGLNIVQVECGGMHTVVLTDDGKV